MPEMVPPASEAQEQAPKLLSSLATRVRVMLASALILAAGALLAPRASPTAVPASPERAAPLLEEQMQPRAPAPPPRRLEDVAPLVRQYGVALLPHASPPSLYSDFSPPLLPPAAAPGAPVADTFVLTHAAALDGRPTTRLAASDGVARQAKVAAFEPATELVLLATDGPPLPTAAIAAGAPVPGTLLAGIEMANGTISVLPAYISSVADERYRLSPAHGPLRAGTPLYSLDGELVAIAGGEGDAFSAAAAVRDLTARAATGERVGAIGVAFQELTPSLRDVFGSGGALVAAVVEGGPAGRAGLRPGDVITAIGGASVEAAESAVRTLRTLPISTSVTVTVRRQGRQRTFAVTPAPAFELAAQRRTRTPPPAARLTAGDLFTPSDLAAADLPPAASIVTINGRDISARTQAQRELRQGRNPALLLLRDGARQYFATVSVPR